ncbi:MAG: alpha/beta fold hydrolase, partial [Actinomycetes bacterium]
MKQPLRAMISPTQHQPFRTEWTVVDRRRWQVGVSGPLRRSGQPGIVLVHGLGCSHRYFAPLAAALDDLPVVAPDLPGFGGTPGPPRALDVRGLSGALTGWLRASGNVGAVIVANSAGCQVAVDLAAHSPELVGPAVLVGPTMDTAARNVVAQAWRLVLNLGRER